MQLQLQQQELHPLPSNQKTSREKAETIHPGHALWLSLMPRPDSLQACLPIHWSEEILSSTKCTALELAVDSAYFTRAQAMDDLVFALRQHATAGDACVLSDWDDATVRELCSTALDIVQTRSCRLERPSNYKSNSAMMAPESALSVSTPIRVLAPLFDLINHGSSYSGRPKSVNAEFGLELVSIDELNVNDTNESTRSDNRRLKTGQLVVRATRNMAMDEEVLIDYGPSTRPAWRCLLSYGFVPTTTTYISSPTEEKNDMKEAMVVDEDETAEVYMGGQRYEVGSTSIPFDMVIAVVSSLQAEEGKLGSEDENGEGEEGPEDIALTPPVVQRLSQRLVDAASYLIQEPELGDARNSDPSSIAATTTTTVTSPIQAKQISLHLAASLRWSHRQVLVACAKGLLESFPLEQEGTK